jgi:hypothetical protein
MRNLIVFLSCLGVFLTGFSAEKLIYDAVIVGAGHSGTSMAIALKKKQINNIVVFDENEEGLEEPWLNYAVPSCVRAPEYVFRLEMQHLSSLRWFDAKYDRKDWTNFNSVPRTVWNEYLQWYRQTLDLPIINNTTLGAFSWDESHKFFIIPINTKGENKTVYAKNIIFTKGVRRQAYPNLDFQQLSGKTVAIQGNGWSAIEAVRTFLRQGAGEIHFYTKEENITQDDYDWFQYCPHVHLHFDDLVGSFEHLITINPTPPLLPALKNIEQHIAKWSDRIEKDEDCFMRCLSNPCEFVISDHYEFTGSAPYLSSIFYCIPSKPYSKFYSSSDIFILRRSIDSITHKITQKLE